MWYPFDVSVQPASTRGSNDLEGETEHVYVTTRMWENNLDQTLRSLHNMTLNILEYVQQHQI